MCVDGVYVECVCGWCRQSVCVHNDVPISMYLVSTGVPSALHSSRAYWSDTHSHSHTLTGSRVHSPGLGRPPVW